MPKMPQKQSKSKKRQYADKYVTGKNTKRNRTRVICNHWVRVIIALSLKLGAIFGFILIFTCGNAQYGISMLSSVFQGTATIILSWETKANVNQNKIETIPTRFLKLLLFLSFSYFGHFLVLQEAEIVNKRCNQICAKYFHEHEQVQTKFNTTSLFTTVADCNEQCELSVYFFEYAIFSVGSLHFFQYLVLYMYRRCNPITNVVHTTQGAAI